MVIAHAFHTAAIDCKNHGFIRSVLGIPGLGFVYRLTGIEGDCNPSVVSISAVYGRS
jgi:hypothetical protein